MIGEARRIGAPKKGKISTAVAEYLSAYLSDRTPDNRARGSFWLGDEETLNYFGVDNPDLEVKVSDFKALLDAKDPRTGRNFLRAGPHALGTDFTFSAPPWASQALIVAPNGAFALDILKAETAAIQVVSKEMERLALAAGTSMGQVKTIMSAFRHEDSRAGQADRHVHAFMLNLCIDANGKTRAVETSKIFEHKLFLGQLYQNVMRQEMRARGWEVGMEQRESLDDRTKTPFKISTFNFGLTEAQTDALFGARRKEIEAALEKAGKPITARRSNVASLDTRKKKSALPYASDAEREIYWAKEAEKVGVHALTEAELEKLNRAQVETQFSPEADLSADLARIIAIAMEGKGRHGGLIRASTIRAAVAVAYVDLPAEELLAKAQAVEKSLVDSKTFYQIDEDVFVPREAIEREREMVAAMARMARTTTKISKAEAKAKAAFLSVKFGSGYDLSDEQKAAVKAVLEGRHLTCIEGRAGTGKSTMAKAMRIALEADGYQVLGAAPSGAAALGLSEAGIEAKTAHKLLLDLEKGATTLTAKSVVVVDEAGMLATPQAAALVDRVRAAGARLVLIGDRGQFPAVGLSGSFDAAIGVSGVAAELVENRRQDRAKTARRATGEKAREGVQVLDDLDAEGALFQGLDLDSVRAEIVADYLASEATIFKKQIGTETRAEALAINLMIREKQQERGEISMREVRVMTQAKEEDQPMELAFSIGEKILFTKNTTRGCGVEDASTGLLVPIKNGSLGVIKKIKGNTLFVETAQGKTVRVDTQKYRALAYGHAATLHKSQGATLTDFFVRAEGVASSRQSFYVALTRHTNKVKVYLERERREVFENKAATTSEGRLLGLGLGLFSLEEAAAKAQAEAQAIEERQSAALRTMLAESQAKAQAEAQAKALEERRQADAKAQAEAQAKALEERRQADAKAQAEAQAKALEERRQADAKAQAEAQAKALEERRQADAKAQAEAQAKALEERRQADAKAQAEAKIIALTPDQRGRLLLKALTDKNTPLAEVVFSCKPALDTLTETGQSAFDIAKATGSPLLEKIQAAVTQVEIAKALAQIASANLSHKKSKIL